MVGLLVPCHMYARQLFDSKMIERLLYLLIITMNHTEIFEHPESLQEFEIIANAFELNSLLRKAKVQEGLNRTYFHVSEQKNIYMYARCKYCKAKLNFKREENAYRLTLFRNHHTHSLQNRSLEIESFIASMPSSLTTNSLMKMTRNAFKIS